MSAFWTPTYVWAEHRNVPSYIGCGDNADNWYGLVEAVLPDGRSFHVICQHGGSMWLCRDCAVAIMQNADAAGAA